MEAQDLTKMSESIETNLELINDLVDLLAYNLTANINDFRCLLGFNNFKKVRDLIEMNEFKEKIAVAKVYRTTSSGSHTIYYLVSRAEEVFKTFKLVESKKVILKRLKKGMKLFLSKFDLIDFDRVLEKFSDYYIKDIKATLVLLNFKFKELKGKNRYKKTILVRKSIKIEDFILFYLISNNQLSLDKLKKKAKII